MYTQIHYTSKKCGVVATFGFEQETIEILLSIQRPVGYPEMFKLQAGFEGGGAISGIFYCVDKICETAEFCASRLFQVLCEKIKDDVQQKIWDEFTQQICSQPLAT